jgi:hypothetical protein
MSTPSTTRLADLPENITMQAQPNSFPVALPQQPPNNSGSIQSRPVQGQGQGQGHDMNNTYIPMNIHPNPYIGGSGGGNGGPDIPFPENVHQGQRLPSRDIPMDSAGYIQDEQIKVNYIPPPTAPTDYIKEYDSKMDDKLKKHEQNKYRKEKADDIFAMLQTPLFLAILYFFFQLPIINRLLYRSLSFMPLFREDGNLNLYGMLLKSLSFGSIYLAMDKIIQYLTFL